MGAMKKTILLAVLLGALTPTMADARKGEVVQGQATVIDGDTIRIRGERIRLYGIDAPERHQPCFTAEGVKFPCSPVVTRALEERIRGQTVACQVMDVDRWGRLIGRCDAPAPWNGTPTGTLNRSMLASGFAVAMRRASPEYVREADIARRNRIGLWNGKFEDPYNWRRRNSVRE